MDKRYPETYRAIALSTAHLSGSDIQLLEKLSEDSEEWMVFNREPGFLLKLYDEIEHNLNHSYSVTLNVIITMASLDGVRLIEFDRDVEISEQWAVYL